MRNERGFYLQHASQSGGTTRYTRVTLYLQKQQCIYENITDCMGNERGFYQMSRHMGKPTICLGEDKGADQLRSNREADQRLCFRYSDSTVPLLLKSEISSF